ncbi:MAG: hypothetical protein IJY61_00830 [Candidatus Gastranaerophilales bacterium]|nr:hypothetical protein [Candidatus Gastranaerophilales bacterium]
MKIINSIFINPSIVSIESKPKQKNSLSPQIKTNYELPNYNSAISVFPSFTGKSTQSTISALKKQSKSPLYKFNEKDKFDAIPSSFANCFADKKTNIVGAGSIFSNFFHIDDVLDSYFGDRENIQVFDPKFSNGDVPPKGYTTVQDYEDVKDGSAIIFSPNIFHAKQVKELSERGTLDGIYVEKPMCINREELKELEKTVKKSKTPLYFGDYFYFGQIAGLRLMGVPMPYKESVNIDFDNSDGNKFTKSIDTAIPFFKEDEIASIQCNFTEQGADDILDRQWLWSKEKGGGVLLDLQVHASNLLNLMGLELTDIDAVTAEEYPCHLSKKYNPHREKPLPHIPKMERGKYRPLKDGEAEDKVTILGEVNGKIPIDISVAQYEKERSNNIVIVGKNQQKIKITIDDFNKHVELLDKDDNVIAKASSNARSYALMLHHAQTFFNDKETNKTPMFFDTQKKTLEQIFKIKDIIEEEIATNIN